MKFAPKKTGGGDRIAENIKGDRWGSFAPKKTVVVVNLVTKNSKFAPKKTNDSMIFCKKRFAIRRKKQAVSLWRAVVFSR